ncbi:MAG: AI-2E family transporter [Clostridiales bacterium]|nr:AI-2E family transporter [Clostridiales bacterium]
MDLNKTNMKKIMGLIVFTILILVGIENLDQILNVASRIFNIIFPFVLGGAIAFIINMPMRWIEKTLFDEKRWKNSKRMKKLARPLSLLLSICLIVAVVVVVFFVVVPQLGETFIRLSNDIRLFWPKAQAWGIKLFEDNPGIVNWINGLEMDWDNLMRQAIDFLKNGAGTILGSTVSVAKTLVSAVTNFVIAFVFAIYIVLQKEKLCMQVVKVLYAFLPEKFVEQARKVFTLTHKTFSNFFAGQCMEALILGTMFCLAMVILRFPYALLVGVLIAFTALIPIFGAFIGCAVGTFLILVENPMQAIAFVVLFLVLQQIEGNLIYPHVVGSSVGLPSIWVLVAVTLGGSLMGIVGMLIFIPLTSVIYTLFRGYVYKCLKRRSLLEKAERSKKTS